MAHRADDQLPQDVRLACGPVRLGRDMHQEPPHSHLVMARIAPRGTH